MLDKIKYVYHTFSDAVISNVFIASDGEGSNSKVVKIHITCLNWQTENWEKIELYFRDVFHIQYFENSKLQNNKVFEAFISNVDGNILVDFFPIQVDGLGGLATDPKSSFMIKCKHLIYNKI